MIGKYFEGQMFQSPQEQNKPLTAVTDWKLRQKSPQKDKPNFASGNVKVHTAPNLRRSFLSCTTQSVSLPHLFFEWTASHRQSSSVLLGCSICRSLTFFFSGTEPGKILWLQKWWQLKWAGGETWRSVSHLHEPCVPLLGTPEPHSASEIVHFWAHWVHSQKYCEAHPSCQLRNAALWCLHWYESAPG